MIDRKEYVEKIVNDYRIEASRKNIPNIENNLSGILQKLERTNFEIEKGDVEISLVNLGKVRENIRIMEVIHHYIETIMKSMIAFLQVYSVKEEIVVNHARNHASFITLEVYYICIGGAKRKTKAQYNLGEVSLHASGVLAILYELEDNFETKNRKNIIVDSHFNRKIEEIESFFNWTRKYFELQWKKNPNGIKKEPATTVSIVMNATEDIIYFLSELKKTLSLEGFSSHIICTDERAILYHLEYLPNDFLMNKRADVRNYLNENQLKYNVDVIIICSEKRLCEIEIEMEIEIIKMEVGYVLSIRERDKRRQKIECAHLDYYLIEEINAKIIDML